jgi:hypothetical protein
MNTRPFWPARALSILSAAILVMFAVGEGLNLSQFTPRELVLFSFFPVGVCLGMAVAWRREVLGGGITVASVAGFYLAHRLLSSGFPRGLAFVALALPGFMFLLGGLWRRSTRRPQSR